jgi:hypothetical protein
MPLSCTIRRIMDSAAGESKLSAYTRTTGGTPGRWNFRALPMRF